jgi:UrcA family protein
LLLNWGRRKYVRSSEPTETLNVEPLEGHPRRIAMPNMHNASVTVLTALCALNAGLANSDAGAVGSDPDIPTATVRYSDLNLTSDDGVRALYLRLRGASRQVCRAYEGQELVYLTRWQTCYTHALDGAVARMNIPALTSMHAKVEPKLHVGLNAESPNDATVARCLRSSLFGII